MILPRHVPCVKGFLTRILLSEIMKNMFRSTLSNNSLSAVGILELIELRSAQNALNKLSLWTFFCKSFFYLMIKDVHKSHSSDSIHTYINKYINAYYHITYLTLYIFYYLC